MELEDYSGELNSHAEYLNIIKLLERKSEYIEYTLKDEDDTKFIEKFKFLIMSVQDKNEWWGTRSGKKYRVYKLRASKEIFQYLQGFETFCKYTVSCTGDIAECTDFGFNDIAFFDKNNLPLLFTTTHEGYIFIRNDIKKLL